MSRDNKEKNILFIKHFEISPGGVSRHVQSLAQGLEAKNIYIISKSNKSVVIDWYKERKYQSSYFINKINEDFVNRIIKELRIDVIHVHHLMGWKMEEVIDLKKTGVPILLTIHDLELLKNEVTKDQVRSFDKVIFPSSYTRERFVKKNLLSDGIIIEHGIPLKKIKRKPLVKGFLKIGFIGLADKHKGIREFFTLISESSKWKCKWVILGKKGGYFNKIMQEVGLSESQFTQIPYDYDNVQRKLLNINADIYVFPSEIPESYSYTLSEVMSVSTPVIARDVGAVAERLKEYKIGWLYSSYKELKSILNKIINDKSLLKEQIKRANKVNVVGEKEMIEKYNKLYSEFEIVEHKEEKESTSIFDGATKFDKEKNPEIIKKLLRKSKNPIRRFIGSIYTKVFRTT